MPSINVYESPTVSDGGVNIASKLFPWQRISRVLSGQIFGDGVSGSATVSSDPNTRLAVTGTITETHVHGTTGSFSAGDLVMIHQSRGTGVGQWEINKIVSDNGDGTYTLTNALTYTYVTYAQMIKIPRYTTATISAHSPTAWNGSIGGIEIICANTSATVSGALSANALGYRGGVAGLDSGDFGTTGGESGAGYPGTVATGAGLGVGSNGSAGGYGTDGGDWDANQGGHAHGSADLIEIDFGGGGTGSCANPEANAGAGGASGGVLILISKSITLSAGLTSNGGDGVYGVDRGGAGGSGGAILLICNIASIGTYITATGGEPALASNPAHGGVGRIAIHHSGTITGTSSPTYKDILDNSLVESLSGGGIFMSY